MQFSIRFKMFFGLMMVVISFVLVVNFIIYSLLNTIAHQEIAHGLENTVRAYNGFDEQRRKLMLTQVHSMAQTAHLKATFTIPEVDSETIYYAGIELKDIADTELLLIVNDQGELISDINNKNLPSVSLIDMPGIKQALNAENYYGIWKYHHYYFRIAISPSIVAEQVVGLIIIGQRLDSTEALQVIQDFAGTPVILLINKQLFSVPLLKPQNTMELGYLQRISTSAENGKIITSKKSITLAEISLDDGIYMTATLSLQNSLGSIIFFRSLNSVASSVDPIRQLIFIVSALTILFGLLLSLKVASSISKPIIQLTKTVKEYGKGNLDLRIKPQSKDETGALTSAFNSMADDIKANRQILLESIQIAEAASRSKSIFLATMSHEIRTPLNGVLGMADLLSNTQLTNEQHSYVSAIDTSGQNLLDIISEILDFSKIEAGKLELHLSTFNLREMIENIGSTNAGIIQKKGLEFICNIPPDVSLIVEGDEVRLRQVLTNLIGNSIKFTERGYVEVRLGIIEKTNTNVSIRFEVLDTGIGIEQSKIKTIFQSFTQADDSTTRKFGGTGLGLTISQQLIGLMGSDIHVSSQVGIGTRFYFDLSLAAMQLPDLEKEKGSLIHKRVIIVDDVSINRTMLQNQLKNWNVPCEAVNSGKQCLETIQQAEAEGNPYQIALLDYNMPEIDGLELAQAIQNETTSKKIHLVLLSCTSDNEVEQKAKFVGICTFLLKPVSQSNLYDTLLSLTLEEVEPYFSKPVNKLVTPNPQHFAQNKSRILVVEDTTVNQQVLTNMLDWFGLVWFGYEYVLASNGSEALNIAKDEYFDVILMDCQMPIMDGFEASQNIREFEKESASKRVPIIAITANAIEGDRDRCLKSGMDDYLTKPFKQIQLQKILVKWLNRNDGLLNQTKLIGNNRVSIADENTDNKVNTAIDDKNYSIKQQGNQPLPNLKGFIENSVIVDSSVLEQFRKLQKPGRQSIIQQLMKTFFTDSPVLIRDMQNAVECTDPKALSLAAHALKSSSANLGAIRLFLLCKAIEQIGRMEKTEGAIALLKDIQIVFTETKTCLIEQNSESNS